MLTRTPLALAALALALLAAACASPCHDVDEAAPAFVAVSNFLHPPFSSRDDGGCPIGVEVELVEEAAARLGHRVEWQERPFSDLLAAVAAGKADVAVSTIGITEDRAQLVDFSAPYQRTDIVALVRLGEGQARTLRDLRGKRIGTARGTTAVAATAKRLPDTERVLDLDEGATWAEMLADGRIDAIVLDASHAETFMERAGMRFRVIDEALRVERFGIAVRKGARELREALDEVIAERFGDGAGENETGGER